MVDVDVVCRAETGRDEARNAMVLNFAWMLGCWVEGAVATGGPGVCADFVCEPETPTEEACAWRPETPREAISMIWPLGRGPGQILLGVKNGGQDRHDRMNAFRCVVSSKNSNSATGTSCPPKLQNAVNLWIWSAALMECAHTLW